MAKTRNATPQTGLTRGKGVLIGVLAIVLAAVLYLQYGRDAGGSDAEAPDKLATRAPGRKTPQSATVVPAVTSADTGDDTRAALLEFDQTKWKSPELSKLIAHDPFALPAGFPQPPSPDDVNAAQDDAVTAEEKSKQLADALAELRMQLDELKERGVHVIVGHKDQYVAMIGDRMIHVGDEINGFTVTDIDPKEGVRVERKSAE